MAMSVLKLRNKQLLYKRVPEQPPFVLSECLQVTQKTILNHNSTSTKKPTHGPSECSSYPSTNVKANDHCTDHQRPWKTSRQRCLEKSTTVNQVTNTADSGGQFPCPVINVQIIKKKSSQDESNLNPHTPRLSPSPSRTPHLNSQSPRTPKVSPQDNHETLNTDKKDIENIGPKRSCLKNKSRTIIRGSMINAKTREKDNSNYCTSKTNDTKSIDTKDYIRKLNILGKTHTSDTATSILECFTSPTSKRNENGSPRKNSLWEIPKDGIKHRQRRELKRSKTSTGYYQDRKDVLPPRNTKSARQQRCCTAPATSSQCLTDTDCRTICQRLEDYLYNDNLPKFQEHLLSFSNNDKTRVIDFKETKTTANLFFRASGLTKMSFVKFMLESCSPNLELKGPFFVGDEHTQYVVTPLWQAAASGHVELVRLLRENGADINAISDTGSSPLLAACFMSHVEVATYLVSNKANINACNAKGLSCLMNAVHSVDLVRLLVLNSAEINRTDNHGNTAMHFATEEGRLITVKILLELGGNPLIVNNDGYNIIQSAAKYRRRDVLDYMLQVVPLKVPDIIDVYELIGAMVIMMEEDLDGGYLYLHKATTLRFLNKSNIIAKYTKPSLLTRSTKETEFINLHELAKLANNPTGLCIQALMVYERQKGSSHDHFFNLLLYCGATFADHSNFKEAANLWVLSYQLNFEKHVHGSGIPCDPFNHNTLKSLAFVVKLLFQWRKVCLKRQSTNENEECLIENSYDISENSVRSILRMSFLHSATAHIWLNNQTTTTRQLYQQAFCLLLRTAICVMYIYTESFTRSERNGDVWQYVKYTISLKPRGERNETLLHMCLSPHTLEQLDIDTSNAAISWPSLAVVNIVLILGGNPTDSDKDGNTPLHYAALLHKQGVFAGEDTILQSLLSKGAHADQVNNLGQTAYGLLDYRDSNRTIDLLVQNVSLKCLSARVITSCDVPYIGEVPASLYSFIELHRSIHVQEKIGGVKCDRTGD